MSELLARSPLATATALFRPLLRLPGPSPKNEKLAIQRAKRWKASWMAFVTAVEDGAAAAALWIEIDTPLSGFETTYRNAAHLASELPILSRTAVAAIKAQIVCLTAVRRCAPGPNREALKRDEGTHCAFALATASEALWVKVARVSKDCAHAFRAHGTKSTSPARDAGVEQDAKAKLTALKAVRNKFLKAAREWEMACEAEELFIRTLRDCWTHEWTMQLPCEEPTPKYLSLLDTWLQRVSAPAVWATCKAFSASLLTLSQAFSELCTRELATQAYVRAAAVAGKKAAAAVRAVRRLGSGSGRGSSSMSSRIAPEPTAPFSPSPNSTRSQSARMIRKQRQLSHRLHTLRAARYRHQTSVQDFWDYVDGEVCAAQVGMWDAALQIAQIRGGLCGTKGPRWLPSKADLMDPAPPKPLAAGAGTPPIKRASRWRGPDTDAQSVITFNPLAPSAPSEDPLPSRTTCPPLRTPSVRRAPPPPPFAPGYTTNSPLSHLITPVPPALPPPEIKARVRAVKPPPVPRKKHVMGEHGPNARARVLPVL
ncbi:hypothetical protein HDU87_001318 [Geranomyces variabilis]|uniref:Uncharacterized protein n=1 Tax=Geranomyces variabilis TaxID=109894 RepID=A0AAD5XNY0_9FUNG|nr:hypothetical protein HDU87_001318 [Geranomyces variabilis]